MAERTVRDFVTEVGIERMMAAVNVKDRMIRHAARQGVMPAKWYAAATAAAKEAGVPEPPLELFDFVSRTGPAGPPRDLAKAGKKIGGGKIKS